MRKYHLPQHAPTVLIPRLRTHEQPRTLGATGIEAWHGRDDQTITDEQRTSVALDSLEAFDDGGVGRTL